MLRAPISVDVPPGSTCSPTYTHVSVRTTILSLCHYNTIRMGIVEILQMLEKVIEVIFHVYGNYYILNIHKLYSQYSNK